MKKRLLSMLLIICCLAGITGCGKSDDNGFVEVWSVTYGDTTLTSRISVSCDIDNKIEITSEEYSAFEGFSWGSAQTLSYNISQDKSNIDRYKIGDYIVFYGNDCYKAQVNKIEINYVNIKIEKNRLSIKTKDEIIIITSSDGEIIKKHDNSNNIKSITTDYYIVNYFN